VIVDTNAFSAIVDNQPGITQVLATARVVAVPVVTLGEYRFGISQSRRRTEYEEFLDESLSAYLVLPVDEQTATFYAEIRHELKIMGAPIPSNDLWIAALCRQHDLPVLSRDRHFDRVRGLQRVVW